MAGSEPDCRSAVAGRADRYGAAPAPPIRPPDRPPAADTGRSLPDVTDDEQDVGWGEAPEPDDDERLLREVPPHHGS